MDLFSILTLIGGLALFLYGMNAMGDGLAKVSGGKLEKILENLTSNPIKAVLLGAGVTAVIQSSSATTVMVVGFVNSGIMKLSQAVGVIMGANIGTTITSWILSLTGIQSDNFIIQMFKPTSFSPVLAIVGVIFILFINDSKKKDIGTIFIGFAILMYGMDMMSSAVKPLAEVPEFTNLLLKFSNPLLGVIAGALLTAVIQSSSASVGILQALCLTGAVPFSAAIPIIMGQNIGTCITAILSAITVMGKEDQPCDHMYDVTGSLCENNDKFAIDRYLPKVDMGDLLVIHDTGAHGFAMGYNYNGKLKSSEILLHEDGSFEMIRRAETPKDYFATFDCFPIYEKLLEDME